VALALGWLFDFLFWKHAVGVNFTIFAALCLIGGFLVLRLDHKTIARRAVWLLPLILFFGLVSFVRTEPLTLFLAALITMFLMALLAISFMGGRWLDYSLADYFVGLMKLAGGMLGRPLRFSSEIRQEQNEIGRSRSRLDLRPMVRGILIALPVLAVFASLLASADLIFGHQLDALLRLFRLERLPEYVFRLIYIVVVGYALAGVFLHAAAQSPDQKLIGDERPVAPRFLGFTETAIVLGSVIALFTAFVFVQFRYFFGGQANIQIAGYTYSEYARRGFGELVVVAFFSLLLILSLSAVTRRENGAQSRAFSGLSVAVVVLVAVMLVSAYQRLTLYEAVFGFSRLRTYTHVVLVWISLLLAAVVALEILHRERAFAAAALIASLGFAATLSLLNVDGFIARQNVNRTLRGEKLDVPYLVSLSPDVVPALVEIFQSSLYPVTTRETVGAVLACRLQVAQPRSNSDWRSFTVSRSRADQVMHEIRAELEAYRVTDDQDSGDIILARGENFYDCQNYPG
jgi:hypothetical protein